MVGMRNVLDDLLRWWLAGKPAALATVVRTWDSAPRAPGATMTIGPDDEVVGSVSGGCVEADVYERARRIRDGAVDGPVVAEYGVADADACAVGLPCGGRIAVCIERVDRTTFPALAELAAAIRADEPVATVTCVAGALAGGRLVVRPDGVSGSLGDHVLDAVAVDIAREFLATGRNGTSRLGHDGTSRAGHDGDPDRADLTLFTATYPPRPRMIVLGAVDVADAVARVGGILGYRVTACDARPTFATPARIPHADEVVVDRPDRYLAAEATAGRVDDRTVLCVLTHDAKFDVPVLEVALRLPLAYVGVMGSRHTHADRVRRLRERGVDETALARLAAPIGLDLGARTPEETAVSIAAEIIVRNRGGSGSPLTGLTGALHHRAPE